MAIFCRRNAKEPQICLTISGYYGQSAILDGITKNDQKFLYVKIIF